MMRASRRSAVATPAIATLSREELARLSALAPVSDSIEDALALRPKIREITTDERIAEAVDLLLRELLREVENEVRIEQALAEIDDASLSAQLNEADDALR